MLEKLMEMGGGESESPELQVLKEIKQLMDTRLGEKLKGGMSVSKVEIEAPEGEEEKSPEVETELGSEGEGDRSALNPDEEEELNKIRSGLV